MNANMIERQKRFRMRVIGTDGDSGITWSPGDAPSADRARKYFDAHAGTVYLAFQDAQGNGYQIPAGGFDPAVHNDVVFMPVPVVG